MAHDETNFFRRAAEICTLPVKSVGPLVQGDMSSGTLLTNSRLETKYPYVFSGISATWQLFCYIHQGVKRLLH